MIIIDRLFVAVMLLLSEVFRDYKTEVGAARLSVNFNEIQKSEPFYKINVSYAKLQSENSAGFIGYLNDYFKKRAQEHVLLTENAFAEYGISGYLYEFNGKSVLSYHKGNIVSIITDYETLWDHNKKAETREMVTFDLKSEKIITFDSLFAGSEYEKMLSERISAAAGNEQGCHASGKVTLKDAEFYIKPSFLVIYYPKYSIKNSPCEFEIPIDEIREYLAESYKTALK